MLLRINIGHYIYIIKYAITQFVVIVYSSHIGGIAVVSGAFYDDY